MERMEREANFPQALINRLQLKQYVCRLPQLQNHVQ